MHPAVKGHTECLEHYLLLRIERLQPASQVKAVAYSELMKLPIIVRQHMLTCRPRQLQSVPQSFCPLERN